MDFKQALQALAHKQHLSRADTQVLIADMLIGKLDPAQISAFFMLLKMKGEHPEELLGAALAVKDYIKPVIYHPDPRGVVQSDLVISCRMGNDRLGALDLSIASAFAAAAAGCRLLVYQGSHTDCRQKGREFLTFAGIKTGLALDQTKACLDQLGLAFHYADGLPESEFAATESLGINNMASLLSLVASPIAAKRYLIGVAEAELCLPLAELFAHLGCERVMVVQSDGLDAISLSSETRVVEWNQGELKDYSILPDDFGVQAKSFIGLHQDSVEESLLLIKDALGNRRGHYAEKAADIIMLNAGAAIYLSGLADTLRQGISMAREVVANTLAGEKIRQAAAFTQSLSNT